MNIDRELLELAAKAAGIDSVPQPFLHNRKEEGMLCKSGRLWNPLTDDGDALRLAIRLRINIEHMKTLGGEDFGVNCWPVGRGDCGVSEDSDLSDYAAITRRAIVRAAAEIGRSMK